MRLDPLMQRLPRDAEPAAEPSRVVERAEPVEDGALDLVRAHRSMMSTTVKVIKCGQTAR